MALKPRPRSSRTAPCQGACFPYCTQPRTALPPPVVHCELPECLPILPEEVALLAAYVGDDLRRILGADHE
jgi:hypothetical protein